MKKRVFFLKFLFSFFLGEFLNFCVRSQRACPRKQRDVGLFAEKFSTSAEEKKWCWIIKYENKEKEKQLETHDVLRYV